MKAGGVVMATLVACILASFFPGLSFSQDGNTQQQCTVVTMSLSLKKGDSFQQPISDLTFKIQPLRSTGWMFSLEDAKGRDFLYPVNPPLRFNGSQTLGAGYGDSAKRSFSHGRELRFLLSESDYDAVEPHMEHALWPYEAPDPDRAVDQYLAELDKLHMGLLRLSVIRSEISENDEVRSTELKVEFITPAAFQFVSSLPRHAVACLKQ